MVDRAGISDLLATIKGLPPLPSGVARLMSLSQADSDYFEKASSIIRADPALAGQVMKVANSALYAGNAPVESLDRAIMRVGVRMVVGLLTEAHLQRGFNPRDDEMAPIWLSNVFSAVIARCIVERCGSLGMQPEVAYTYGLLHDVGRLVMVALFRNGMSELHEENPDPISVLSSREEEMFGFSHNLAGRLLGNRWKFPPTMTLVIAAHHLPPAERRGYPENVDRMIDLVNLSDYISFQLRDVETLDESVTMSIERSLEEGLPATLIERLKIPRDTITASIEPGLRQMARQCNVLGIRPRFVGSGSEV